jgi:hypothetical protein
MKSLTLEEKESLSWLEELIKGVEGGKDISFTLLTSILSLGLNKEDLKERVVSILDKTFSKIDNLKNIVDLNEIK